MAEYYKYQAADKDSRIDWNKQAQNINRLLEEGEQARQNKRAEDLKKFEADQAKLNAPDDALHKGIRDQNYNLSDQGKKMNLELFNKYKNQEISELEYKKLSGRMVENANKYFDVVGNLDKVFAETTKEAYNGNVSAAQLAKMKYISQYTDLNKNDIVFDENGQIVSVSKEGTNPTRTVSDIEALLRTDLPKINLQKEISEDVKAFANTNRLRDASGKLQYIDDVKDMPAYIEAKNDLIAAYTQTPAQMQTILADNSDEEYSIEFLDRGQEPGKDPNVIYAEIRNDGTFDFILTPEQEEIAKKTVAETIDSQFGRKETVKPPRKISRSGSSGEKVTKLDRIDAIDYLIKMWLAHDEDELAIAANSLNAFFNAASPTYIKGEAAQIKGIDRKLNAEGEYVMSIQTKNGIRPIKISDDLENFLLKYKEDIGLPKETIINAARVYKKNNPSAKKGTKTFNSNYIKDE